MLRSAILGAAFLGLAAPAFATSFTFETAKPVDEARVTVIGTVWSCEGTVCKGDMDRKKVTLRDCKKIAKKLAKSHLSRTTHTSSRLKTSKPARLLRATKTARLASLALQSLSSGRLGFKAGRPLFCFFPATLRLLAR
jgi:hypothetical protein